MTQLFQGFSRRRRSGSLAMIASRSASLNRDHCAISVSVRPQPSQSRLAGSMMQIFTQGVETALTARPIPV